jgi:ferredoxin
MTQNWVLPEIDLVKCNRCGICVDECPSGAVKMGNSGPFFAQPLDCTYCAVCETICPEGAITLVYEIVWEERE